MKTMLNIQDSPYALLLFTAVALLVALVLSPIANVDFQDMTMFSVPLANMIWMIPLLLTSLWLLYLLTRRFLYSMTVTWIHVLLTVITTLLIVAVLFIGINPSELARERHELIGTATQILSMVFVFGQLTFLANVLLGLFGRSNGR